MGESAVAHCAFGCDFELSACPLYHHFISFSAKKPNPKSLKNMLYIEYSIYGKVLRLHAIN